MKPLARIINELWRKGNSMPTARSFRVAVPSEPPSLNGDILGGGVRATDLVSGKITTAIYGRNGSGKTTLACQGGEPTCLLAIEPAPTGGARSVQTLPNVRVYQVASHILMDKDGNPEPWRGSDKMLAVAAALKARFARGEKPFSKIVIDGLTSWSDVILGEIMGLDYASMPAVLNIGKVSADQYIERGERLIRYIKPFLDLPCDLWFLAQERDHNPPKDKNITRSGKEFSRPSQTPFMREAHPMAQEGSFFSLGIADTPAKFVQDACDFVMQLYEDAETVLVHPPDVVFNGETMKSPPQLVATGRRVKRLRCVYHPNYAARFRGDYRVIPEYIEAPDPETRYQAFLDVAAGKKTKFGYYPPT